MKFRADEKDIKIFIVFLIFLLYFSAILVLNASSLARTGTFYGIVPFEAFIPGRGYLGSTITIFLLALIGIIASCKSYFFDREKGFGFSFTKKDKGYSRWCKDKEMKATLKEVDPKAYTADAAGIVIINDGKKMWVDDGEMHNIIVGATGSGKTQAVVFPLVQSLAKHEESMIITDPKGEIYVTTAEMLKERGYDIVILNFRDPQRGNAWNPMTLPYRLYKEGNTDKAIELLDDLALNILYDEKNSNGDPFWEKSGADYFSGLALGLFEDASESQVNLNSLNLMSNLGEERYGAPNNNYIKEYFNGKDPSKPAYINASGTVYAPEDTKGGVLSTFKQKVKLFSSRDNLSEMLSHSDFDMHDIGRKKTAVFLIIQDEKKTLHPLATIFIKQCYETLIDVAQECGGHLPYRTNFILDEFANMPPLKDVTTMVTAARSRHIRFNFIIQNYAQLTQVYGKENAETIKGNCNIMYLISNELTALEEISKMCGEVKSKEKDKTASTPLVTVSDLQRLPQWNIINLRLRMMPYKTKIVPNFKMDWGRTYPEATFPNREKSKVELFDIREFVKAKKQEKMKEIDKMFGIENDNNSTSDTIKPFTEQSPFNPFLNSSLTNQSNPFDSLLQPKNNNTPQNNPPESFNVDDVVKMIDAKIAELEEEEKREKEQQKSIESNPIRPNISNLTIDNAQNITKEQPNNNLDILNSNHYDDGTNDDEFFDDFFSDD